MQIYSTGIRSGEFIIGVGKQNKGTILEIKGDYPPSSKGVSLLTEAKLEELKSITFFSTMNVDEIKEYLTQEQTRDNDMYIGETDEPISVRFCNIEGAYMIEHFSECSLTEWYTIRQLQDMVPRKTTSRVAKKDRHTLIFRPSIWQLHQEEKKSNYDGIFIDLRTHTIVSEGEINITSKYGIRLLTDELAIRYQPYKGSSYTVEQLLEYVPKKHKTETDRILTELNSFDFPPAFLKSLMQKLIRTRAIYCVVREIKWKAVQVLIATIILLFVHPGAFVPNAQRFVRGIESAFKRLVVSICEDSWTDNHNDLLAMCACSALSQRDSGYIPSPVFVKKMLNLAIKTQKESKRFEWRLKQDPVSENYTELYACAAILENVKSFQSDIDMLYYIASVEGKCESRIIDERTDTIDICWAIDQHTDPCIAYFFEYPKYDMDYSILFQMIWDVASSKSPRMPEKKLDMKKYKYPKEEILSDIRKAQELLFLSKYARISKKSHPDIEAKEMLYSHTLDDSWLAGMIGPIKIKDAFVVLKTDNINSFIPIKLPTSRSTRPELTESEKVSSIEKAQTMLEKGIKINKSLKQFNGALVKHNRLEEEYIIKLESGWVKWDDCKHLQTRVNVFEAVLQDTSVNYIENAIFYGGDNVSDFDLNTLLLETDIMVLRKVSVNIAGKMSSITLNDIGRDGKGVDYSVSVYDTAVFQFLCKLCVLYPAALELKFTKFKIKNCVIFWCIRDEINSFIGSYKSSRVEEWKVKADERPMWEHQIDVLNTMKVRHQSGKKGNLIWMSMGYGKSLCVTAYIHYLIQSGSMPEYCIWTIPSSAENSIIREIKSSKIPYVVLDFTKNSKTGRLVPGSINIIKHDHLRMNKEELISKIGNCLFIVDEFHKAMGKTQRSSIILDLVKLSRDFIGLSGTIIKDDNTDELIIWLQQIVEFEVNVSNYWVAVGALISRKVVTKVVVDRTFVEADIDEKYYTVVPEGLGGTAVNINFRAALQYSYEAVTSKIIEIAETYLTGGTKVFIVAKDKENQDFITLALSEYKVFKVTSKSTIVLAPGDVTDYDVIITTSKHCEGYTLSLLHVGITGCWFSNQSTRDQLEGRLNRLNQESKTIDWVTVHSGILTYILEKYENVRTLAAALKGFAETIGIDNEELKRFL